MAKQSGGEAKDNRMFVEQVAEFKLITGAINVICWLEAE